MPIKWDSDHKLMCRTAHVNPQLKSIILCNINTV
jgi:hypothetical protein